MFSSCICYLTENNSRIQINLPHAQKGGILRGSCFIDEINVVIEEWKAQ